LQRFRFRKSLSISTRLQNHKTAASGFFHSSFWAFSPCFSLKNAQKLPFYVESATIPACETAVLGAVLPKKAGAEHLSYARAGGGFHSHDSHLFLCQRLTPLVSTLLRHGQPP
jgi:hypothetical protein